MKVVATTAVVDANRHLTVNAPADIAPGEHSVVLVIDEEHPARKESQPLNLPVLQCGPWPRNLSLRREDMYGDNGR